MLKFYLILCIFFELLIYFCSAKNYRNYTLFRVIPKNKDQLDFIKGLKNVYDVAFWFGPAKVNIFTDFIISPADKNNFLKDAVRRNVYPQSLNPDIQRSFDLQHVKPYIRRRTESLDWEHYFGYDDITHWLEDLSKAYPEEMTILDIGRTHENRRIVNAKILLNGSQRRSTVIVEGGIHAREWISPAFVTYFLHSILTAKKSNNKEHKNIALTYEWYFVPVINPDGYEFTHNKVNGDRLWRKNRRGGYGVDINRNFDVAYGVEDVSLSQLSDVYCGPKPFSEKESQAIRSLVTAHKDTLEYYFSFHSYGQHIILPYTYTKQRSDNYNQTLPLCKKAADAMKKPYNTHYTYGTSYETTGYTASGVSACWVKKAYQVPYVFILELRDTGRNGFALPPSEILPTCIETLRGMLTFLSPKTQQFEKLSDDKLDKFQYHDDANINTLNSTLIVLNIFWLLILKSK